MPATIFWWIVRGQGVALEVRRRRAGGDGGRTREEGADPEGESRTSSERLMRGVVPLGVPLPPLGIRGARQGDHARAAVLDCEGEYQWSTPLPVFAESHWP